MNSFFIALLVGVGASVASDQMPNEMIQFLPVEAYWHHEGIEPETPRLLAMVRDSQAPANVGELIEQLGDDSFRKRKAAQKALEEAGPSILEKVKPLVADPDPEVAARARELVEALTVKVARQRVRRLMAIRTLGLRKEPAAVETLMGLVDSKKPFVGEYARVALARIEGKQFVPRRPGKKIRQADAAALPGPLCVMGQVDLTRSKGLFNLREMVRAVLGKDATKKEVSSHVASVMESLMPGVYETGNFRLDLATFGLSANVGDNSGWFVMILRGQYDPKLIEAAVARNERDLTTREVSGVKILDVDEDFKICLCSPEVMVVISGPEGKPLPIEKVLANLREGVVTKRSEAMAGLLKRIDRDKPVWIAMQVPKLFSDVQFLGDVESLILSASAVEDGRKVVVVTGSRDQEKAARAQEELESIINQVRQAVESAPMDMSSVGKLLGQVKIVRDKERLAIELALTSAVAREIVTLPLLILGPVMSDSPAP